MVKYVVRARVEVEGIVDKHDIIGAIFGQTEGLFGSELDLRDLQDKGRIGRIAVEVKQQGSRVVGEVLVPSNLDRVETALVASMLEFVDKVGPFNARIKVVDIVDVRREKIRKIVERAKEIMLTMIKEKEVDIKEVLQEIESSVRAAEITYYGPEKLPAGPDVDKSDTIIIVEGRADVLNLLKYGYKNVIALEGAKGEIPETIVKLSNSKKVIAFLDGDRAGDMILKELIRVAKVNMVARAPPGREVEELSGKEIAKALKNAVPLETYLQHISRETAEKVEEEEVKEVSVVTVPEAEVVSEIAIPEPVMKTVESLRGTLESVVYDKNWSEVMRVPVKDLVDKLITDEIKEAYAIVIDGVITQRLLDIASAKGVNVLIGARIGAISKKPANVVIITFDDIKS
ncbi:MAG: DNA primase DnaG [Sulfolobales archaeon]|nr:DNA primase DnaG [Sulfolobales archaeon]MCX8208097.1 DNA primase DnaG [Sulfolobales archaeon]MDW8010083.1 DNA primase DnaG [Sulfolobales archaeon]